MSGGAFEYLQRRYEWQEAIAKALRQWLAGEIEYRQNHIKLGDAEQLFLQAAIVDVLAADKEYF